MPYTEEERQAALRLYVDEGPQEAVVQTGIGLRTIYRWAAAEGVATTAISEKTRAATTAAKERAGMLRSQLHVLLIEQAVSSLHDMNGVVPLVIRQKGQEPKYIDVPASPEDKKNLALTAAVLIDKFRLEGGEATGRMETVSLTDGLDADTKRELRERLARAVRGESDTAGTAGDSGGAGEPVDTAASPGTSS